MSFRQTAIENASAAGFWLIDQNGNETYKTDSEIKLYCTYDNTNLSEISSTVPKEYVYSKLDFSKHNSDYSAKYNIKSYDETYYIRLKSYDGGVNYGEIGTVLLDYGIAPSFNHRIDKSEPIESQFFDGSWNYNSLYPSLQEYEIGNNYDYKKDTVLCGIHIQAKIHEFPITTWGGTLSVTAYGIGSSHPPYHAVTWQRCDPDIQIFNPGSGSYINAKADTTISVLFEVLTSESGIEYPPTEISLLWGTSSDSLNNTITGYPTEGNPRSAEIIVNANTFPNKTAVYFKIRYKSAAASEYFESDIYNYITNDVVGTVSNLSPNNATINGEEPHVFTWEYSSSSGLGQTAFDLQISNNNGVSWTDLFTKEISAETQATIPANTFYSGSALWKVRGYNTSDEPSPWSEPANIIVLAPPRPPTIREITNTPKIKISWASGDQQAFQVIANDIDSGVVFGTKNIYYVPYYFKDNTVVNVKIRIKNKFGEWSGWATGTVTVKNIPTGEINLTVLNNNDSVNLSWSTDTDFSRFYVLRGGIPIAKITGVQEYTDYTSIGANEYQIMGITTDGYYTLSNVVPVSVFPQTAVIGSLSDAVSWITLTYRRGNLPEIITSSSEDVYFQYYSGRELPVAYSSRFKTKKKTLNFTVYKQDADAIENMIGQTVIYKDYADNKIIGIVNDVETSSNANRPDVRMEITAIDYLEDVGYD